MQPIPVLFENTDLIIVNKPIGIAMHDATNEADVRENIAVREAQKLNIPIFAMVDTNCDPREVDYAIPSNDDASKSINLILSHVTQGIKDGLSERQKEK